MIQGNSLNRSMLALLVTCAALAIIVVFELLFPAQIDHGAPPVVDRAGTEVPAFSESVYVPPRRDDLAEMLDRPLFFKDRKLPPAPAAAATNAVPATPLRLKLEGVAITADSRIAVLRDLSNNQLLQMAEGMLHDGWTLDAVTATGANFKRGADVAELTLEADTGNRRRR